MVFPAVAFARGNVRHQRGRRGILQFCGGDVAGGFAGCFGQLKQRDLICAVDIDANRAVISFRAGGPAVADAAESVT